MQLEKNGKTNYLEYAYKLLSKKSYSSYCLAEKLVLKGALEQETKLVIDHLVKNGYLNDQKLIDEIIALGNEKLEGKYKILTKLKKQHLIDSNFILIFSDEVELDKAIRLIDKLEDKYSTLSYNKKNQQIHNYLARVGYETYIISEAFTHIKPINEFQERDNLFLEYSKALNKYKDIDDKYLLKQKIIKALMAKGYSYSEINMIMEEFKHEND